MIVCERFYIVQIKYNYTQNYRGGLGYIWYTIYSGGMVLDGSARFHKYTQSDKGREARPRGENFEKQFSQKNTCFPPREQERSTTLQ